ncbi:hypothetical protein TNCV_4142281 [Trichonephila clavipes]|nr:hypothetical protein TNCV_4142281 [Trichonephila clavipes]
MCDEKVVFPMLKLQDKVSDYIWRLKVLFKLSGDEFNKKQSRKRPKKVCTTSVDDRRTKILRFQDKRMSLTAVRSDLSDAGVSVSSKTIRRRLAVVRLKGTGQYGDRTGLFSAVTVTRDEQGLDSLGRTDLSSATTVPRDEQGLDSMDRTDISSAATAPCEEQGLDSMDWTGLSSAALGEQGRPSFLLRVRRE